ncbi:MAG: hypothetical protein AAGD32_14625 [Planctomycetota bacterium]
MAKFIRFVVDELDEDSGRRLGVFQAASDVLDRVDVSEEVSVPLCQHLRWLNRHLEPPTKFSDSKKKHAANRAIGWFRPTASEHIARMREICRILNEFGLATQVILSDKPGKVVYEDEHQIATIPYRESNA